MIYNIERGASTKISSSLSTGKDVALGQLEHWATDGRIPNQMGLFVESYKARFATKKPADAKQKPINQPPSTN